jgi:hypothetical protein
MHHINKQLGQWDADDNLLSILSKHLGAEKRGNLVVHNYGLERIRAQSGWGKKNPYSLTRRLVSQ